MKCETIEMDLGEEFEQERLREVARIEKRKAKDYKEKYILALKYIKTILEVESHRLKPCADEILKEYGFDFSQLDKIE